MSQENIDLWMQAARAIDAREVSRELAEQLLAPGFRMENLSTALKPQQASLEGLRAAMRGERDGATPHPIVDRLAGIDRDLTQAGAGRTDPRRTMLRTLGSLDATLVELGENLGLAPTEDVPSDATLSAKPCESRYYDPSRDRDVA